jgi:hypothetical protein
MSPYAIPDEADYVIDEDGVEWNLPTGNATRQVFIPDEADVCGCESKYCTDCAFAHLRVTVTKVGCDHGLWPAYTCRACYPLDLNQRLWIAYYRLKRWLFKPTPWSRR